MASGMSFEALNQIGSEKRNMIIVLNDNNMSISKNVGAFSNACTRLCSSKGYLTFKKDISNTLSTSKLGNKMLLTMKEVKDNIKHTVVDSSFFDEFGLDYIGPVDGHDLYDLIKVFSSLKNHEGPIVVHVITKKGKGYKYAEYDTEGAWHGVSKFNESTGKPLAQLPENHLSWSAIMSETLIRLAQQDKNILAITPAMAQGSKLGKFAKMFPDRFFDCGIAEEHAMTYAAALAVSGKKPFISIYSSFLQRAYDQVNHDIARMKLPVVICVDRSGLVGEDGETHHGVFDISAFYSIPNIIISQPKNAQEAQDLLFSAFKQKTNPFLIRIPRGSRYYKEKEFEYIETGTWEKIETGNNSKVCVITYGDEVEQVMNKALINDISLTIVNARFLKPLDENLLNEILHSDKEIIVYETDVKHGGLSSAILEYMNDNQIQKNIKRIGIDDHFVKQGSLPQLRKQEKIDTSTLFMEIEKHYE